jgi:hypothetical protein
MHRHLDEIEKAASPRALLSGQVLSPYSRRDRDVRKIFEGVRYVTNFDRFHAMPHRTGATSGAFGATAVALPMQGTTRSHNWLTAGGRALLALSLMMTMLFSTLLSSPAWSQDAAGNAPSASSSGNAEAGAAVAEQAEASPAATPAAPAAELSLIPAIRRGC